MTGPELSPIHNYFRGRWLIGLAKQYQVYKQHAQTPREVEACENAIQKLIQQIRETWTKYCQNIGRPDQIYKWKPKEASRTIDPTPHGGKKLFETDAGNKVTANQRTRWDTNKDLTLSCRL